METAELRVLLEATARELTAVASDLPKGGEHDNDKVLMELRQELSQAKDAITDAAWQCAIPATAAIIGELASGPSDILQEARKIRGEAVRARDVAEARLWGLQDEQTELLERLRDLSKQQQDRLVEQYAEADVAASREAGLVERCEQLDNEVRALRKGVDEKSQRLIASSKLGHSLELNKRKLQRQHEGSLVQNAIAREILALHQSTEAYHQRVDAGCSKIDLSLESAQRSCAGKMEALQTEWSEQRAQYESGMAALEAQLLDLRQSYEDRWKATEQKAKEKLDSKVQLATEQRRKMEEQLAKLHEEREQEAIASRRSVDAQKQVMSEAREAAVADMKATLAAKTQEMGEKVDAERRRCEMVRRAALQKAQGHNQEVADYEQRIAAISASYRRTSLKPGTMHAAHLNRASPPPASDF